MKYPDFIDQDSILSINVSISTSIYIVFIYSSHLNIYLSLLGGSVDLLSPPPNSNYPPRTLEIYEKPEISPQNASGIVLI